MKVTVAEQHVADASLPPSSAALLRTAPIELPVVVDGREVRFSAQAFCCKETGEEAIALLHFQDIQTAAGASLVRVHSGCVTGDIFHSLRCDCHEQLQRSLQLVAEAPAGAIIYLPGDEGRGIGLFQKIRAYALQERGLDTVDANAALGLAVDARDYVLAARTLAALGMSAVRLLTNNPDKVTALERNRIAVLERVPLAVRGNPHNERYLNTKRDRLSHTL